MATELSKKQMKRHRQRLRECATYYLTKAYDRMSARIKHRKSYANLPICSRREFIEWSLHNDKFIELWSKWRIYEGTPPPTIVPSIDRMIRENGYVLNNLQWISYSENAQEGGLVGGKPLGWRKKDFKEVF